jgi:hypothetical protein
MHMGLIAAFVHVTGPKEMPMPRQRLAQVLTCLISGAVLLLPFYAAITATLTLAARWGALHVRRCPH